MSYVASCECRYCAHAWVGVLPESAPSEELPCPRCGEEDGEYVPEDDEDDDRVA